MNHNNTTSLTPGFSLGYLRLIGHWVCDYNTWAAFQENIATNYLLMEYGYRRKNYCRCYPW